jgi:hypothetical protein
MKHKRRLFLVLLTLIMTLGFGSTVYADDVGDIGGTEGGGSGTNVYTFYYSYDSGKDAIVLNSKLLKTD